MPDPQPDTLPHVQIDLPIRAVLPAVRETLAHGNLAVVQAPPGAGKSTLLPLALLDAPWLADRCIVMLEPRRLAARSVAGWMAHLLGEPVGERVGYRIRLDNRVSRNTRIEVVTEGVLTRMLQEDPALERAGCVIFDEFHERSLHADLGLALCLDAQTQLRHDLRILLMSATLDAGAIAAWLGNAPVVTAEGRSYPVGTRHLPRSAGTRIEAEVVAAVRRAGREHDGDMLVFLPGSGEIRCVQQALADGLTGADVEVLPLYGDLPPADQERAIAPGAAGRRRIVLATSIAETSLTIEGVRIVIDSGLSRRAQFDPRSGMTRLATVKVSRAAADQRRGRAGRLASGVCYRLWSEETGKSLQPFTPPEILEADLAPLALELAVWGVGDPAQLRWLTPPPAAAFAQARELLTALDAIDTSGRITAHGRAMNTLGTHPRLAHMLLRARASGLDDQSSGSAFDLACDLAALLSERDLLKLPAGVRFTDMRARVEALRDIRDHLLAGAEVARAARERVRKLAQSWRTQLGTGEKRPVVPAGKPGSSRHGWQASMAPRSPHSGHSMSGTRGSSGVQHASASLPGSDEIESTGLLLALAYPDRIARMRAGQPGRYQLSNGRGAVLPDNDPLARQEFLAIADLDAGEREARVYLAAPLTRAQLQQTFATRIAVTDHAGWDSRAQAVVCRREQRLGRLVIGETPLDMTDLQDAIDAMIDGIRQLGIGALPWNEETRTWQQRVLFLRRLDPELWPDVSEAHLLATVGQWLAPCLAGITRREHLSRIDLRGALRALLPRPRQQQLDEQAPTHLTVPSGSRIALDYAQEGAPILAARLQEMFGLHETPRIARGRAAVIIHLLSPAGRPVQVTRDLASFWAQGYQDVKKELKGRYPKHYWPDDPMTAVATRKVRPRRGE